MKKTKSKSDQSLINTWLADMRLMYYPWADVDDIPFKPTGKANVFEVNMGGVIFTATFERKKIAE